ncbi:MAG: DUF2950 domain-containing protein [Bryobacteraceae bacterium]
MSARVLTLFLAPLMIGVPVSMWAQQAAPAQTAFDSPEAAAQALIDAAAKNDTAQLSKIFGPNGQQILTSGDPGKDQAERQEFSQLVQRKHKLEQSTLNMNVMILTVGDEDWPFPVPLVRTNGKWRFDTTEGKVEMRARRIGANELDAIEICSGYVEAQRAYATKVRDEHGVLEYAQQIMSSSGKNDGLYWPGADALVPEGFAAAEVRTGSASKAKPYHGYYFRVLKSQGPDAPGGQHNYASKDSMFGGFALVAWPADYGMTGVHTFIVNQDGMVYERDMGKPQSNLTTSVTRYNPDKSWVPVD